MEEIGERVGWLTEMRLRTIYDLEEEGVTPLRARIAERLDRSGPTVSRPWPGWAR